MCIQNGPQRVGGTIYLGRGAAIEIGRSPARHLVLQGPKVSRKHCRLVRMEVGWRLVDLDSANGLCANGSRITNHELQSGDVIDVGEYQLRYVTVDNLDAEPATIDES